jgi:phage terminase large subunit GpA-like protein
MGDPNCVWDEFNKIIKAKYQTDTGKRMSILAAGLDSAPYTNYSYPYMKTNKLVIGTKGNAMQGNGIFIDADYKPFMMAKEKNDLWILNVNKYKDNLADLCGLIWDVKKTSVQPAGFLNFPQTIDGKYTDKNYFSHFEAEHKVIDPKSNKFIWQKKTAGEQNHIFDCRILNMAAKDIFIHKFFEAHRTKIKDWRKKDWSDFVKMIFG